MLVIMGSSPALIHCNMSGTWKLSTLKLLEPKPAKTCCMPTPAEKMDSCMDVYPMTFQPTITCDDNIVIPTPAEMVPLMALLGICIDNWLLQIEQPQIRNLSDDHFIVPPRGILCHHCVLLC